MVNIQIQEVFYSSSSSSILSCAIERSLHL